MPRLLAALALIAAALLAMALFKDRGAPPRPGCASLELGMGEERIHALLGPPHASELEGGTLTMRWDAPEPGSRDDLLYVDFEKDALIGARCGRLRLGELEP